MPEASGGAIGIIHDLNQYLTLYLQRKWEDVTYVLLPTLLSADERGGYDYSEYNPATGVTASQTLTFDMAQILASLTSFIGNGFLAIRLSSWTAVAGGTITINSIQVRLLRNGVPVFTDTLRNVAWVHVNLAETKGTYFLTLPNLNFTVDPTQTLQLEITINYTATAQAGYVRVLYKRGEAESYLMLPVIEG